MTLMKRIVYVVNKLDYFLSHRLPLAQAAIAVGYDVHVVCPFDREIALSGITFHDWSLSRSGMNPFKEWSSLVNLHYLIASIQPDLVHALTIKPVIYTGILRRLGCFSTPWVATIPGMGYVFAQQDWKRRSLQWGVGKLYQWALKANHVKVIFQNRDDLAFFCQRQWLDSKQSILILGSGVCPETYAPKSVPEGPVVVILPARLLKDKGVVEWVEAIKLIRSKVKARFALVGACDPGNPASLTEEEIQQWVDDGILEHWGWQEDMIAQFAKAHIVCLPSYREGLPKVLIEAASCEKAIVTTDVPGCREVVFHEKTGLLVPAQSIQALSKALQRLIDSPGLRKQLGQAARQHVIESLSLTSVNEQTLKVYEA